MTAYNILKGEVNDSYENSWLNHREKRGFKRNSKSSKIVDDKYNTSKNTRELNKMEIWKNNEFLGNVVIL